MTVQFSNRREAGVLLAEQLEDFREKDAVVYALPRGGVPVGFEIAKAIGAPLDLVITRKIGHPYNPEYAVCAIAEDGSMVCNEEERVSIDPGWITEEAKKEQWEAMRRRKTYLAGRPHISATGKTVILADDGVATGLTMRAAIRFLRKEKPSKIIVAVPVAPHGVVKLLEREADQVVAIEDAAAYLGAVGAYYRDFPQVSDAEVVDFLEHA